MAGFAAAGWCLEKAAACAWAHAVADEMGKVKGGNGCAQDAARRGQACQSPITWTRPIAPQMPELQYQNAALLPGK